MLTDIAWHDVDTLLLDMDGTLLDLAFDSHFWQQAVPEALSIQRKISLPDAQRLIDNEYHSVKQTLNWYCLDYWSERLQLDIYAMMDQLGHRAVLRDDTLAFLHALKASGKQRILLTNAHPYNLKIKLKHTGLSSHLDLLLSTHTFGYPKEDQRLWQAVANYTGLDVRRTLFIVDSEAILDAAKSFGIRYCVGISNPDSGRKIQIFKRHPAIADYHCFISVLSHQEAE